MRKISKKEKKNELRRRYDVIKNMMSSLTMATVTFVAAVILIPVSAKAEFLKVQSTENQIIYQVSVTDTEESLDVSTLFVVLENQLEYYEQHISLGEYSGYFDNLNENTTYSISVYGNKGFGEERLTTKTVKTTSLDGGVILKVSPISNDYLFSYMVYYQLQDQNNLYHSYILRYMYSSHFGDEVYTSDIVLDTQFNEVEINDIYTESSFQLLLIGVTDLSEVVLDQIDVTPPFQLNSSLYITNINRNQVGLHMYFDERFINQPYTITISQDEMVIKTLLVYSKIEFNEFDSMIIDQLQEGEAYTITCYTKLINPQTLRSEEIEVFNEMIETLKSYEYTYQMEQFDDVMLFELELNDPNDYFQYVYYEIYDQETYIEGNQINFIVDDEMKTGFFEIYFPVGASYTIKIGIRSNTDYQINEVIYENIVH